MPIAIVVLLRVMAHDPAGGDRRAEHAGQARRVKAEMLAGALGGKPGAQHALVAGDQRRDQVAPRDGVLFGDRERGDRRRRARMHADAGLAQIVELEGMRERAVGQSGGRRADARAAPGSKSCWRRLPPTWREKSSTLLLQGRLAAEQRHRNGIDEAGLGDRDHRRGNVLVAQRGREFRERLGFTGHSLHVSPCPRRRRRRLAAIGAAFAQLLAQHFLAQLERLAPVLARELLRRGRRRAPRSPQAGRDAPCSASAGLPSP